MTLESTNRIAGPWIAILSVLAVLAYGYQSYIETRPYDVAGLNKLSYDATHPKFRNKLQEVWQLSDQDINQPINLWETK